MGLSCLGRSCTCRWICVEASRLRRRRLSLQSALVLRELFEAARQDAEDRERHLPKAQLVELAGATPIPADAYAALAPSTNVKLIAEIKRASPSRGDLAAIPDPVDLGLGYEAAGANAISVLTERTGFKGSLTDLSSVSAAVSIPTLRKDFISSEYQILEARAAGASFVLLILAELSRKDFMQLNDFAHSLGLGVLVETHNEAEIDLAAEAGARLIGINTRDLKTFQTDIGLFERMAKRLPSEAIKVAESSVKELADVVRYRNAGADVVLVGEALVTGDFSTLIPQIVSLS